MDRKRGREEDGAGDDTGGEISMSIEETNKLRISLGLKPLQLGNKASEQDEQAKKRHQDAQRKQAQEENAKKYTARQQERKRQRAEDDFLNVKGLGEPDEEEDMVEWAEKQRMATIAKRAEEAYERKQAAKIKEEQQQKEKAEYSAADLAGLKVRHNLEDMMEGESMVLTLADKRILDEKGNSLVEDEDELINTVKFEQRQRDKAREAAAPKAKPLWEEDGKRRGILDKYDEEEADIVMQIGEGGGLSAAEQQRKDDMRRKLEEGAKRLESAAVGVLAPKNGLPATGNGLSADFQTEAEAAATTFKKRDKKKGVKKERKLRAKSVEPEVEDTASLIEQLENAAAAENGSGTTDLGSRRDRMTAREKTEALLKEEAAQKRERFEAAVQKSNWASEALRQTKTSQKLSEVVGDDDDDGDRELQESLARARRLAMQSATTDKKDTTAAERPRSTVEEVAAAAAKAREEEEARINAELAGRGKNVVNDTSEFVRNIQLPAEGPSAAQLMLGSASVLAGSASTIARTPAPGAKAQDKDGDDDYMGLGEEEEQAQENGGGGWVSMDVDDGSASVSQPSGAASRPARQIRKKQDAEEKGSDNESEEEEENVVGEQSLGRGLAGALAMLKERGNLTTEAKMVWAGRTNDRSKNALQGLVGDVYAGGSHDDRLARSIETALTIKDEFGRVLTPKERFRHLCYDFHGKLPSKNKEEKRIRKANEDIARRKQATSEVTKNEELEGLKKVTEKAAQPYVVLQGKGAMEALKSVVGTPTGMPPPKPRKPSKSAAPPPPGNLTPLLGDKKVEVMLGISKGVPGGATPSSSQRLPPPPAPPPPR